MTIRTLEPNSKHEIELVAVRMGKTLVDVLGREKAASMYSLDGLRERVLWHLSPERVAEIFLAEDKGEVIGHAIVRVENKGDEQRYGFFSTIYVLDSYRGQGVATKLISAVEKWSRVRKLNCFCS